MEPQEYDRLREYERTYWWHVGRRDLMRAVLRRDVPPRPHRPGLDVGCGTGHNFELLQPYGRFVGTEVVADLYRAGRRRPSRPVVIAEGKGLPFADGCLEICTMFDVLEHVEEEDRCLAELHRVLRPGGLVLATVPAYMFLWSAHDVSLRHFRRYERPDLQRAFERNDFEIVRITFAMATVLPLIAGYRLLLRVLPRRGGARSTYVSIPRPLNTMLAVLLSWEARWLARRDLPFGATLVVLARKKERDRP